MKIQSSDFRYTNSPQATQHRSLSAPNFGLRIKPSKTLKDVFQKQKSAEKGLNGIEELAEGEFGTVCKGSKPLQSFWDEISPRLYDRIQHVGRSTNSEGWAHSFLKTSADKPISTSSLHDCAAMYLFNKPTNTHFLYHSLCWTDESVLDYMIKNFMKEGFTSAAIIPGDKYWTHMHEMIIPAMFRALQKNSSKAPIQVFHDSSRYPEVVGYKGKVFEIPNVRIMQGFKNKGQASFKISDLQGFDTIDRISQCNSLEEIAIARKNFKKSDMDIEIKKVLTRLLNKREAELKEINSCKTFEDLKNLLGRHDLSFSYKNNEAIAMKREQILNQQT